MTAGERFGRQVANIGDVDGNGTDDLAIGADFALRYGRTRAGEVTVALLAGDKPEAPPSRPRRPRPTATASPQPTASAVPTVAPSPTATPTPTPAKPVPTLVRRTALGGLARPRRARDQVRLRRPPDADRGGRAPDRDVQGDGDRPRDAHRRPAPLAQAPQVAEGDRQAHGRAARPARSRSRCAGPSDEGRLWPPWWPALVRSPRPRTPRGTTTCRTTDDRRRRRREGHAQARLPRARRRQQGAQGDGDRRQAHARHAGQAHGPDRAGRVHGQDRRTRRRALHAARQGLQALSRGDRDPRQGAAASRPRPPPRPRPGRRTPAPTPAAPRPTPTPTPAPGDGLPAKLPEVPGSVASTTRAGCRPPTTPARPRSTTASASSAPTASATRPGIRPRTPNPATGETCTFGHEHGDDPATSDIAPWVAEHLAAAGYEAFAGLPFGLAAEALNAYADAPPRDGQAQRGSRRLQGRRRRRRLAARHDGGALGRHLRLPDRRPPGQPLAGRALQQRARAALRDPLRRRHAAHLDHAQSLRRSRRLRALLRSRHTHPDHRQRLPRGRRHARDPRPRMRRAQRARPCRAHDVGVGAVREVDVREHARRRRTATRSPPSTRASASSTRAATPTPTPRSAARSRCAGRPPPTAIAPTASTARSPTRSA